LKNPQKIILIKNPKQKEKILLSIKLKRFFEKVKKEDGFKSRLRQKDLEDIWFKIEKYEKLNKKFGTFFRNYKEIFKKEFPDFKLTKFPFKKET